MNHIYIRTVLCFLCILLAYVFLSKLILVTVFCAILAVLYFKDDSTVFRYVASHVAYLYLWISELCSNIQIMYHQSNSTNFPVRKCIENNGTVSNKLDRLHHRLKSNVHNLNSTYSLSSQPLSSTTWNSTANVSSHSSKSYQSLQEISKLSINPVFSREDGLSPIRSVNISSSISPLNTSPSIRTTIRDTCSIPSTRSRSNQISQDESQMRLDAKLFANVSSPGFCGRIAEGLAAVATHQAKYDTAGAFPVVNFKNQSSKIKIKTPVRVRLAPPPSNDILYSSIASSSIQRSPVMATDESMKSVLQVLKEISRKRIHSHVEEDCDENSKRLRISESQYNPESMLQTSLLQQTIQGKRAREESSPNEDDVKKRRRPSFNNEYFSSLSSSVSIKAPHLESKKRKAQAVEDSFALTPVLGKLLKVQTEITPPQTSPPQREETPPQLLVPEPKLVKAPSPMVVVETVERLEPIPIIKPVEVASSEPEKSELSKPSKDESSMSRLLGRMSGQTTPTPKLSIPTPSHNMFMSTNDLSLSPPKENRLAAMIAVLGGPSEISGRENMTPVENKKMGKALFTSPESPETPKQNKKVTFNDSLTTTKIYDRDKSGIGGSTSNDSTLLSPPTNKPSDSSLFNLSKSSILSTQDKKSDLSTGLSPLQFNSSGPNNHEEGSKPVTTSHSTVASSSLDSSSQQNSSYLSTSKIATPSITSPVATTLIAASEQNTQPTFSFGSNDSTPKKTFPSANTSAVKTFSFGNTSLTQPVPSTATFSPVQASSSQIKENLKTSSLNLFSNKDGLSSSENIENESKPLVNGFAPTSTSQFTFNALTPQTSLSKPSLPAFDINTNKSSQNVFNFTSSSNVFSKGNSSSTTVASSITQVTPNYSSMTNTKLPETNQTSSSVTANQTNQPAGNMFGNPSNLSTSSPFSFGAQSQPSSFSTPTSNAQSSSQNSVFGNNSQQSSTFTIATTQSNSNSTSSAVTPTNTLFGSVPTSNSKPIPFSGGGNPLTPQSNPVFGTSNTQASTNNSPFSGISRSSNTPQTGVFGTQNSSTSASSIFGNMTTTSDSKPALFSTFSATTQQSSTFNNSSTSNQISKPIFSNLSNPTPKFGDGNNTTSAFGAATNVNSVFKSQNPAFGSQSNPPPAFGSQNTAPPAFGSQSTAPPAFGSQSLAPPPFGSQSTAPPAFGSQSTAPPAFGSQSTAPAFGSQNSAPPAFGSQNTSGGFSMGTSSSAGNETKSAFTSSSSSPFMFGSSAASNQPSKPVGASAPFSFGSSQPTPTQANSTHSSIPTFSSPNPAFGGNLQPPSFAASVQQPATTTVQGPVYPFGQNTAAPSAGGFQFNAIAPQPMQGGMFNIGSGSTAPRSKTGSLRRRQK